MNSLRFLELGANLNGGLDDFVYYTRAYFSE